jgi:ubiquinone biosynthesis protein
MDFVKGVKVTDLHDYAAINCDPKVIAKKGMESLFRQMFEHGFFHGDPHPGNIFVLPGNRICLIDFGMMGNVIKSDLYSFADILLGIRYENANKVLFGIKNLMVQKRILNERKLLIEIDDMMYLFNRQKPEEVKLDFFFNRLRDIVREQKIQMPADFFVLSKAMVTIEGVGRRIYPDMDILIELEPHLKGVFRDRYSPGKVWERIVMNAGEIMSVLENMPGDTRDIVQNVKEITGKYDSVEKELTRFSHSMKRTSAQIELAIVLGIWLICSTLLMAAKFPPLVADSWSLFGLFGYFISFIAGYRLLKK